MLKSLVHQLQWRITVDKWEDLKDKYIRVKSDGFGTRITKIGHITEDHWFDIDEFFKSKAFKESKNDVNKS